VATNNMEIFEWVVLTMLLIIGLLIVILTRFLCRESNMVYPHEIPPAPMGDELIQNIKTIVTKAVSRMGRNRVENTHSVNSVPQPRAHTPSNTVNNIPFISVSSPTTEQSQSSNASQTSENQQNTISASPTSEDKHPTIFQPDSEIPPSADYSTSVEKHQSVNTAYSNELPPQTPNPQVTKNSFDTDHTESTDQSPHSDNSHSTGLLPQTEDKRTTDHTPHHELAQNSSGSTTEIQQYKIHTQPESITHQLTEAPHIGISHDEQGANEHPPDSIIEEIEAVPDVLEAPHRPSPPPIMYEFENSDNTDNLFRFEYEPNDWTWTIYKYPSSKVGVAYSKSYLDLSVYNYEVDVRFLRGNKNLFVGLSSDVTHGGYVVNDNMVQSGVLGSVICVVVLNQRLYIERHDNRFGYYKYALPCTLHTFDFLRFRMDDGVCEVQVYQRSIADDVSSMIDFDDITLCEHIMPDELVPHHKENTDTQVDDCDPGDEGVTSNTVEVLTPPVSIDGISECVDNINWYTPSKEPDISSSTEYTLRAQMGREVYIAFADTRATLSSVSITCAIVPQKRT
jgi:hypothetical protein